MAMIEFDCSSCGRHYKVPASAAGRKAKCKKCGGQMQVPSQVPSRGTPADSPIGLAGDETTQKKNRPDRPRAAASAPRRPKQENVDLSALYAGSEPEPEASALDALASASGAAFDFESPAPRSRSARSSSKKSGPPMALLIGGAGGAVALLAVVVVVVIAFSGGGDEKDDAAGGLVIGDSSTIASSSSSGGGAGFTLGGDDADQTQEQVDDEPEQGLPPVVLPELVDVPAADAALDDWTIQVDPSVAEAARQITRAGVVFTAPTTWKERSKPNDDGTPQIRDTVAISPDDTITVSVTVGKHITGTGPDWPAMMTCAEAPSDYTPDQLIFGKVDAQRGPNEFVLVPEYTESGVHFGTLLGGYRFVRFALKGTPSEGGPTQVVHYLGSAGSLYIHITITGRQADADHLAEAEWIARSARLMTESELDAFAKKNALFSDWLKETGTTVSRLSDDSPVENTRPVEWAGFDEGADFSWMMTMAGAAGPYRSPYRVAPVQGLELAATSRLAIRWRPSDQGLWMAMEVRDLGSRWRRKQTPMVGSAAAMIAGREMGLPAGTEQTEFKANGLKVFRFLLPENPLLDSRQVYYVALDRGVLITLMGRFAKDQPGDIELLDAAAKTLSKS